MGNIGSANASAFGLISSASIGASYYITLFGQASQNCSFNHGSVDTATGNVYIAGYNSTATAPIFWKNAANGQSVTWQIAVGLVSYRGTVAQISADRSNLYGMFLSQAYSINPSTGAGNTPSSLTGLSLQYDACSPSGTIMYVCGSTSTSGVGDAIKLDMSTSPVTVSWSRTYSNATPASQAITPTGITKKGSSGAIFVCGSNYTAGAFVQKISETDGSVTWVRNHIPSGATGSISYAKCVSDASDNVYCTGYFNTTALGNNFWIAKTNTSGALQWSKCLNTGAGVFTDQGFGVCMSSDESSIYVWGKTGNPNGAALLNINASTGALNWQRSLVTATSNAFNTGKIYATATNVFLLGDITYGANRVTMAISFPADGSKTGTYTTTGSASFTWTYASSSYSYADTPAVTVTTTSWSSSAAAGVASSSTTNTLLTTTYSFLSAGVVT